MFELSPKLLITGPRFHPDCSELDMAGLTKLVRFHVEQELADEFIANLLCTLVPDYGSFRDFQAGDRDFVMVMAGSCLGVVRESGDGGQTVEVDGVDTGVTVQT